MKIVEDLRKVNIIKRARQQQQKLTLNGTFWVSQSRKYTISVIIKIKVQVRICAKLPKYLKITYFYNIKI